MRPYSLPPLYTSRSRLFVDFSEQLIFWSKKNNFLAFLKWIALQRRKNSLYLPRRALKLLIKSLFMEKTPFYRTKAFWTLVASIIAALAAYFTVSCSYSQKVFRHGVHHDTVKVESTIKSRNLSCLTKNLGKPFRSPSSSILGLSTWKHSLQFVPITPLTAVTSLFDSPSRIVFGSKVQSIPLSQLACRFILPWNKNCSTPGVNLLSMSSESQTSFSFIFARFSGSCCASRSLSSRRPRKRKTPSKGKKHNNWRETPVIVDHVF